jgi:diguanylate cyclase (GGDEF)-like protein
MNRLLRDLSVSIKAFTASTVLLLFMAALGTQASLFLSSLKTDLKSLSDSSLPKQQAVLEIAKSAIDTHVNVFRYVAWASAGLNPATLNRLREQIGRDSMHVEASLRALAARADLSESERAAISDAATKWQRYATAVSDTVEITTTDPALGTVMLGGTDEDYIKVAGDLQITSSLVTGRTLSATQDLLIQADVNQRIIAWGGTLVVLVGFAVTLIVARSFVTPIKTVTRAMQAVSVGDPHVDLGSMDRKDEIGQMLTAISSFRERLKRDNRILAAREQDLIVQNMRFDAAISNMSQGLAMFDHDRKLIVCNTQYAKVYGLPPELMNPGITQQQILEHRVAVGSYPGDDPQKYITDRIMNAATERNTDTVIELRDGRVIAVSHRAMPDGGWVSTHQDVTEKRRTEQRIAHMASHDALTNLPNRTLFRERMEQALARVNRGESVAVLCLDLDRFKEVNDTLGHPAGDELLGAAAERLQQCVRDIDTIARLGGDEFAIIQTAVKHPEDVLALVDRILETINHPFEIEGHEINVGASIGIAVAPTDGDSADQLLKHADLALYDAKMGGRRTYRFFEPEMNARVQARRNLELDLRGALARGEFELYYQPVVNIATRQVSGFEALIRWNHPARGLILPGEFIPLAEEISLINPIGEFVLRQACSEAAKWPEHLHMAVNVSAAQFKDRGFVQFVTNTLATSRLNANRLEIEITESVSLDDDEATLATLRQLHGLGVRIALDDFGTGYSSLSYLRSFPFDKIKIDRSLVKELGSRPDCAAVVGALASLASSLGMITTAEGVETEEQLEHLKNVGCAEAQGYVFCKPRPARDLPSLVPSLQERLAA